MMANLSTPIESLPTEMRINLFSYCDLHSLMAFRSMSRQMDEDIRISQLFIVPKCYLSDRTAKHVVKSTARIKQLIIRDLKKPGPIELNRGAEFMKYVQEIVFGTDILKQNMNNVLKQIDRVQKIRFESTDKAGLGDFIRFNRAYQHLRTLDLFLGNQKHEATFLKSLVKQGKVKFPHLEKLNFKWNLEKLYWGGNNKYWQVYTALHKLLWIHRNSIKSIKWNFDLMYFNHLANPNTEEKKEFKDIVRQILDVNHLQDVEIQTFPTEGNKIWKLSTRLVSVQTRLVNLHYQTSDLSRPIIIMMETMGLKIANTIEKLEIRPRSAGIVSFPFTLFDSFAVLKELRMPYFRYRPEDIHCLPRSLTCLALNVGDRGEQDLWNTNHQVDTSMALYREVLSWIGVNLKRLTNLQLILKGQFWVMMAEIPTVAGFKTLINALPELVEMELTFPDTIINSMKSLKSASVGKKGLSVKWINDQEQTRRTRSLLYWNMPSYMLKFKINRATFKNFHLS